MSLDKLKTLVKAGKLHYLQTGGGGPGGGMGGGNSTSDITTWVEKHGTLLKPSAYDSTSSTSSSSSSSATSSIYRLDPSDL
jgi:hypothetical protein